MQEDLYYPHTSVQDLLWDILHYITEPIMKRWPFNKLREQALRKTIKYMRYEAIETRYITIGCVEKVRNKPNDMDINSQKISLSLVFVQSLQMMCWWAEDPNCDEFKYHLARVPDYLWLAEDGMTMQVWFTTFFDFSYTC